ncbi:MAG: CdaR family protein [Candidatus Omnitrophica bacterium]|nr:CdaR family protein [Candidatus Omnitrophota bacterium]
MHTVRGLKTVPHGVLKLLSLLLSVVLWFYVTTDLRKSRQDIAYREIKNIQVSIMGDELLLGKNLVSVELEQSTVDVRVRGVEQELARLSAADVTAYVDVRGFRPGKTYNLVVRVVLPENILLVGAAPRVRVLIKDAQVQI